MSDKLRQGISVLTTFSDGEQPTGAKLNSITAQLRHAAEQLEKAVGDIHGQSWPYGSASSTTLSLAHDRNLTTGAVLTSAAERKLDIANLGRLIGPASNLNPRTLDDSAITESVPVGVNEFSLRYKPVDPSDIGTVFTESVPTSFITYVSVKSNLLNAGEYHVSSDGKVYTVTTTTGGTVDYNTDPLSYGGGQNPSYARHNVIPDLNQISAGGTGLSFSAPDGNGRRTATLPTATHAQSNYVKTSVTLDATDAINGVQLKLPKVLVDNYINGDLIPPGYLYLKNVTTGEVYEDAEYLYGSETTFLVGDVDLTTEIDRGDKFVCITVGSDITTAIDDLRVKSYHSHDRTYGEPFITLDSISGFTQDAGNSGAFVPSEIPGNFAPQYLHRDGYDPTLDTNANIRNAMRGDIAFIGVSGDIGVTGETYGLLFGNSTTQIYRDANNDLILANGGLTGSNVHITDGGAGSGGRLVPEEGISSERGGVGIQPYAFTGTLDQSAGLTTITDLVATHGFVGTETIWGIDLLVNIGGGNNWYTSGNAGVATGFDVSLSTASGLDIVYDATGSQGSLTVSYRCIVWYMK